KKPAKPLFQSQNCGRHMIVGKRIAALTLDMRTASGDQGIGWNLKREFVNDDSTQRFTFDIDTLPETCRCEQYGVRSHFELFDQSALSHAFALNKVKIWKIVGEHLVQRFHLPITCKQDERAAL